MKNKTHRKRFFIAPMSKMKNQHVADGGKKEALKRPQWIVLIIKKKRGKHPTAILFNYGNRLFFCLIAVDADMETSAIPWKSSNIQRLLLSPFFQIAGSINKTWRFSLNICFHPFFYLRHNPQSCDEMDQSLDLAGKKKKVFGKLSSKGRKWSINRHLSRRLSNNSQHLLLSQLSFQGFPEISGW